MLIEEIVLNYAVMVVGIEHPLLHSNKIQELKSTSVHVVIK
jgi:hypothetical protein